MIENPAGLTPEQIRICHRIVRAHETGKPDGDPAVAIYLPDGAGLTAGMEQATDRADSLDAIMRAYLNMGGAYRDTANAILDALARNATVGLDPENLPPWAIALRDGFVRIARLDPVMRAAQNAVFDRQYWLPSVAVCAELGLRSALAHAVIYDTRIQSSPSLIDRLRRTFAPYPPAKGGRETMFLTALLNARRNFLLQLPARVQRESVYRVDSLLALLRERNLALARPLHVRVGRSPVMAERRKIAI